MAEHNDLGHWGEQKVAEYLEQHGWYIRDIDWKYKHYDLDLVAIDAAKSIIRIVEVKTRSTNNWGDPDKAITLQKKTNILKAGAAYLKFFHLENCQVFYDSASVVGTIGSDFTIEYKKNVMSSADPFYNNEQKRKKAYYERKHRLGGKIDKF